MPDQKPPRLAGDDRASLLALLQYQRESFVRKVAGVDTRAGPPAPSIEEAVARYRRT